MLIRIFMHRFLTFTLTGFLLACSPQEQTHAVRSDKSPVEVREFIYDQAPFPSCHASTIVETRGGDLLAAWFGGTDEGEDDVTIWLSRQTDQGWTAPVEVADGIQDDTLRYPCWNPVLFQPRKGALRLYYKVGPNPREWWGMVKYSQDEGRSWSGAERLADSLLGPVRNKMLELDGGLELAPSSTEHDGWRVHVERSTDGGNTWQWIGPVADPENLQPIQPAFLQYPDGRLRMLCRSKKSVIGSTWSEDQGASWSPMEMTELPNPNSGIDAVTLQDGRHLLVYNPTQMREGKWGGPRSPLVVAISGNGDDWEQVALLENEPDAEFSYPAVIQTRDGKVHITYTWKREKIRHVVMGL
jgi:predicted neuraminidase